MINEENEKTLHTCRSCLQSSNVTFPIFEDIPELNLSIATMFNNCSIEIGDYEEFPKTLCSNCFTLLQTVHNFIQTFKQSQELLLNEYLKQNKGQIIVISDDDDISVVNSSAELNYLGLFGNDFKMLKNPENTVKNTITEDLNVENDDSNHGDSDDQDFLIEQSVQLTKCYKNKLNGSESESDSREVENNHENIRDNLLEKKTGSKRSPMLCPVCHKTFKKFSLFTYHLSQHKGAMTCDLCLITFNDSDIYLHHYQMKHRYQCTICQKSFPKWDPYRKHVKWHTNGQPRLTCPIESCTKTFAKKLALQNHYKTIHCDKHNYLCNLCGAPFKNYDNFRYHMNKHKGPSHLCTYCGRAFMQAVHLTYHVWRYHTGKKPHKCTHCEKRFVSKKILSTHMIRKHSNNEGTGQKEV